MVEQAPGDADGRVEEAAAEHPAGNGHQRAGGGAAGVEALAVGVEGVALETGHGLDARAVDLREVPELLVVQRVRHAGVDLQVVEEADGDRRRQRVGPPGVTELGGVDGALLDLVDHLARDLRLALGALPLQLEVDVEGIIAVGSIGDVGDEGRPRHAGRAQARQHEQGSRQSQ